MTAYLTGTGRVTRALISPEACLQSSEEAGGAKSGGRLDQNARDDSLLTTRTSTGSPTCTCTCARGWRRGGFANRCVSCRGFLRCTYGAGGADGRAGGRVCAGASAYGHHIQDIHGHMPHMGKKGATGAVPALAGAAAASSALGAISAARGTRCA